MSKIFYDRFVSLEEVEMEIKAISQSSEEKEELWKLVDEIVNHRVVISILDRLPISYHEEFLHMFHTTPHDESHFEYINDKIEGKIEDVIAKEIDLLKNELLNEIKALKSEK
jgi:hypothetical protein